MTKIKNLRSADKMQVDFDRLKKASFTLRALNHKTRQNILQLIHKNKEITVSEIYSKLHLEQSRTSTYLAILRKAGVVNARRDGQSIYYSVNYDRLATIERGSDIVNGIE